MQSYIKEEDLVVTLDLKVILIILIITLNLHDPSLSGSDCNTRPNSLGCGSNYKVVSQKCDRVKKKLMKKRKKILINWVNPSNQVNPSNLGFVS